MQHKSQNSTFVCVTSAVYSGVIFPSNNKNNRIIKISLFQAFKMKEVYSVENIYCRMSVA